MRSAFRMAIALAAVGLAWPSAAARRPNILWIVWDTVRADRMSVYGYDRPTTPFVSEWAKDARVFGNCLSAAPTTVSSHASMFTGLMPGTHRADNTHYVLPLELHTIAEHLRTEGYRTYLFSANPLISADNQFAQGFDKFEHPWGPERGTWAQAAIEAIQNAPEVSGTEGESADEKRTEWGVISNGALAEHALTDWLDQADDERPYFAFLNYMEAHLPRHPPHRFRRQVMPPDLIPASYRQVPFLEFVRAYSFQLKESEPEALAAFSATYDASLAELDDLFRSLIAALDARGALENTVVILTSDHGEHLESIISQCTITPCMIRCCGFR